MNYKELIHLPQLMYWLTIPESVLYKHFINHIRKENYIHKQHIFVDMDSPILYVVHIDTVQDLLKPRDIFINNSKVYATGLDDRLGCYIAFRLNLLGLKGDVLMCDHEEIGLSTAKYFETDKQYNWVCEFDRAGTQVVTYDLSASDVLLDTLEDHGFEIGEGTYTDIKDLCLPNEPCMFNLGIGYKNAHNFDSSVDLLEFVTNINKFEAFYKQYKNIYFPNDWNRF